ncbi:MAG: endonuclease/exonuclease/phosphatase family protein [Thermoguttaceae bacterium]|nr:endonuclease/exonuclease/phosphatase family protein [Thermoguttaceae bacterium]MBQ9799639.1 endonuclease/exonuclease/phosphatase family protein [Thermoguttaceae bacterium]
MKLSQLIFKSTVSALAAFVVYCAATAATLFAAEPASTLTLVSYNVHNAIGLDGKTDFARIAKTLTALNPDVVALQELDSKTKRSKGRDVLEEIAKEAKMNATFGPAIDFQGGKYGIGVLSKEKPLKSEYFSLPGREERRCLLMVEFERYIFCCSHWSLTAADRDATVKIVTEKMKSAKKPVFVAGDFNAKPSEASMRAFVNDWTILSADAPTFPANKPSVRIDYICAADPTGAISADAWTKAVVSARVVEEPVASDHAPIVVELSADVFK